MGLNSDEIQLELLYLNKCKCVLVSLLYSINPNDLQILRAGRDTVWCVLHVGDVNKYWYFCLRNRWGCKGLSRDYAAIVHSEPSGWCREVAHQSGYPDSTKANCREDGYGALPTKSHRRSLPIWTTSFKESQAVGYQNDKDEWPKWMERQCIFEMKVPGRYKGTGHPAAGACDSGDVAK